MTDPLGAQGSASCECTIDGYLSVTSKQDTGILSLALDSHEKLIIKKSATQDWFTMDEAIYRNFETSTPFAGVVPYSITFALDSSSGVWATAA